MIWETDTRGEHRFSSLVKQNKKAKICFVIYIAGKKKLLFYIYAVIVKQNFYKRPTNYYYYWSCAVQQYAEALQCPEGVSSAHFARDGYYSYDVNVLLFITAPITKLFTWGEGDSGGHLLWDATSLGLWGLVCPSRTSERGGKGDLMRDTEVVVVEDQAYAVRLVLQLVSDLHVSSPLACTFRSWTACGSCV